MQCLQKRCVIHSPVEKGPVRGSVVTPAPSAGRPKFHLPFISAPRIAASQFLCDSLPWNVTVIPLSGSEFGRQDQRTGGARGAQFTYKCDIEGLPLRRERNALQDRTYSTSHNLSLLEEDPSVTSRILCYS
ncbi:hypothetical protein J6590_061437 [Homalodisca vitripennis]|nr:hypothetical protein J6590_061437 [Homalodisca vitripennis]